MFEEIDNLNVNRGLSFNNKANDSKKYDKNVRIWDNNLKIYHKDKYDYGHTHLWKSYAYIFVPKNFRVYKITTC